MQKLRLNRSNPNFYNFAFLSEVKFPAHLKKQIKDYYQIPNLLIAGTVPSLILQLEQRLDVILVRSQLVSSLRESRQLINHRKIQIDKKTIPFSGFLLQKEDSICLVEKRSLPQLGLWKPLISIPPYLEVNYSLQSFIYLRPPTLEELFIPFYLDNTTPLR